MKKPSLLAVILYGICAVIWTVRAIVEIVMKTYNDSVFLFILSIFCALIWICSFFACLISYRSNKDE